MGQVGAMAWSPWSASEKAPETHCKLTLILNRVLKPKSTPMELAETRFHPPKHLREALYKQRYLFRLEIYVFDTKIQNCAHAKVSKTRVFYDTFRTFLLLQRSVYLQAEVIAKWPNLSLQINPKLSKNRCLQGQKR